MPDDQPAPGALDGVRVLDLVDERGIYGAKLLADLGADVIRVEPPGGDPLRHRGPFKDDVPGPTNSLYHAFFASSRRFATVDANQRAGQRQLTRLSRWADIVLDSGALEAAGVDLDSERERHPELVKIVRGLYRRNPISGKRPSLREIGRILLEQGYSSVSGGRIGTGQIRNLLS